MTTDTRSPEQIEREIERERAQLTDTLGDLQDKFSVESLIRQVADQFKGQGGDISRSVARSAKENPVALALTGIGLAWMIFGSSNNNRAQNDASRRAGDRPDRNPGYRSSRDYPLSEYDDEPDWARYEASSYDETGAVAMTRRARNQSSDGSDDSGSNIVKAAKEGAAGIAENVKEKMSATRDSISRSYDNSKSSLSNTGSRIAEGTENFSEEARARVVAARRHALAAREKVRSSLQSGTDKAAEFYEEQPLVVGALALAAGAALGSALPRTRMEDNAMGSRSDSLWSEAERIYNEEREKANKVVKATTAEVKQVAEDAKRDLDEKAPGDKSAVDAIVDKAKEAADRVAETAKKEAEEQKLGTPRSSETTSSGYAAKSSVDH